MSRDYEGLLCIDCVHYSAGNGVDRHLCDRLGTTSLVDGSVIDLVYLKCSEERVGGAKCGPDGWYWESRDGRMLP